MAKPILTVTKDFTQDFFKIVSSFKNEEVLVGIPSTNNSRNVVENEPAITNAEILATNAEILAINEFGSAANNIPARPVMKIGIKNAQEDLAVEFKNLAIQVLSQGVSAFEPYYNKIGIIASQSIKQVINTQDGILPPSAATLVFREAKGFKGTHALLVTAQLRNSITYVVKRKL